MKATVQLILGVISAGIIWIAITKVAPNYPVPNAYFNNSVVLQKETAISKNKEKGRVIFVGGSNVTFGIKASLFEEETGIPAVNFGCVAGMGPELILYKLKPYLRDGDTIVMAWEYGLYKYDRSNYINITYLNLIHGPMDDFLTELPVLDEFKLRMALPVMSFYSGYYTSQTTPTPKEAYKAHWQINNSGDLISNKSQDLTKEQLENQPILDLIESLEPSSDMHNVISKFLKECKNRNINVIATWPNFYGHSDYHNNKQVERNISTILAFWEKLRVPMAGAYTNAIFENLHIHNTPYHLNESGAVLRTQRLIKELKPYFEERTPTPLEDRNK